MNFGAAATFLAAAALAGRAEAGAWPIAPGQTQAILKLEHQAAGEGLDLGSATVPIPYRRENNLSVFFEHGLTSRFTLQGKLGLVEGVDGPIRYSGRGPFELGLRGVLWRRGDAVASLYLGGVVAGAGVNALYAGPGAGKGDVEARLLVGASRRLFGRPAYEEVQIAALKRRDLPNETRMDTTVGVDLSPRWTVMLQSYSGMAYTAGANPRWLKGEVSLVRRLGPWRLQAGWRSVLAGRETSKDTGPVLAIWKTF